MTTDHNNLGGGSGGGSAPGVRHLSADTRLSIEANQVMMVTRPTLPPAIPQPFVITIFSPGLGIDGEVDVAATQGVRITAAPLGLVPVSTGSTNGVEIMVGELQNVTIKRGLIDGVDQSVEMTPSGITVDGGAMPVTIKSLTQITLSVADGMSTVTLGPTGVQIQGVPMVQIQGGPLVMIN